MSVLHIAYYVFLRNVRDWKLFLLLLVLPLFLTMLMAATGSMDMKKQKVQIAYYAADTGQPARQFEQLLNARSTRAAFDVQHPASYDAGKKLLADRSIETFIYIGEGFSQKLARGEQASIEVFSSKSLSPAKLLVQDFVSAANSLAAADRISGEIDLQEYSGGVRQVAISPAYGPTLFDRLTYLSMLAGLFLGAAILAVFSVIKSNREKTLARVNASPISCLSETAGQYLGNLLVPFICAMVLINVTHYAWGANWQGNLLFILLAFLLFSAVSVALGMICGYLAKKPGLSIFVVLCLQTLFFMQMFNSFIMQGASGSQGFQWINLASPHYYCYRVITGTIFGGSLARLQASLVSLAAAGTVLTALTLFLGRRKPV